VGVQHACALKRDGTLWCWARSPSATARPNRCCPSR
jgi:hypothetical protein